MFRCPHCDKEIGYDPALVGQMVRCMICRNVFEQPAMGVAAPQVEFLEEVDETPLIDTAIIQRVTEYVRQVEFLEEVEGTPLIDTAIIQRVTEYVRDPRRRARKTLGQRVVTMAIVGGIAFALAACGVAVPVSQYSPVFGGFIEKTLAPPWSQPRIDGIPIHLFAFGLAGVILGAVLGSAVAYLTDSKRE